MGKGVERGVGFSEQVCQVGLLSADRARQVDVFGKIWYGRGGVFLKVLHPCPTLLFIYLPLFLSLQDGLTSQQASFFFLSLSTFGNFFALKCEPISICFVFYKNKISNRNIIKRITQRLLYVEILIKENYYSSC